MDRPRHFQGFPHLQMVNFHKLPISLLVYCRVISLKGNFLIDQPGFINRQLISVSSICQKQWAVEEQHEITSNNLGWKVRTSESYSMKVGRTPCVQDSFLGSSSDFGGSALLRSPQSSKNLRPGGRLSVYGGWFYQLLTIHVAWHQMLTWPFGLV